MPRKARIKSSTNIYHVVIRGADRQLIFEETKDYKKYLNLLQLYSDELEFDIYAYCLMSNHVHLLIHAKNCSIETIFRHINTHYAVWFNMKYKRTGHVQQDRYYSEPVETNEYLLSVLRYIHQNPTKAGLEAFAGESYAWSSIGDYLSDYPSFVNTKDILNLINGIENFKLFHKMNVSEKHLDVQSTTKRTPDDVAKDIIFELTNCKNVTEFQNLPLLERNTFITTLHRENGLSIRQLNRLTGVPKGVIDRIVTKGRFS